MKPTAGYAKPRPATGPVRTRTRLNLQRRPKPEPRDGLDERQDSGFWKVVLFVALFHVLVIIGACIWAFFAPEPKPPADFISLLPPGDVVKGTPGAQQAHKVGAATPAAPSHHAAPPAPAHVSPPQPKPKAVTPPVEQPPVPTPIIKDNAPPIKPVKPPKPEKPKAEPVKPKVKIDLHEVERTDTSADAPPKPTKHHTKKLVKKPDDSPDDTDSSPDTTGLSKEQIAAKLGDKLDENGSHNAQKYGDSGVPGGHANDFSDFYAMIANQVRDEWNSSNSTGSVQTEPIVGMHVERSGYVSPDSVHLIRSSGDPTYDASAIETVKRLGQLHEPLPDGCPPDITIHFNPNPTQ